MDSTYLKVKLVLLVILSSGMTVGLRAQSSDEAVSISLRENTMGLDDYYYDSTAVSSSTFSTRDTTNLHTVLWKDRNNKQVAKWNWNWEDENTLRFDLSDKVKLYIHSGPSKENY